MIKRIDGSSNWNIRDTERDQNNPANHRLMANESNGEDIANGFDLNSNGFYLPDGDGDTNFLGGQFIYMAFAENPMQYLPQ